MEEEEAAPEQPPEEQPAEPPAEPQEAPQEQPEEAAAPPEPPEQKPEIEPDDAGGQPKEEELEAKKSVTKRQSQISKTESKTAAEPKDELKTQSKAAVKSQAEIKQTESRRQAMTSRMGVEGKSGMDVKQSTEISARESKKSLASLGMRGSKELSLSKEMMFFRKKSSRSVTKAVGSIISFRRGSVAEYFDRQKTAKFMNTYKLDSDKPFNVEEVEKILKEVLIEALDNLTYDTDKVPKQAKWASNVIRTKVKEHEFDRYKLICNVTIGEKRSQDMYSTYRFLWDAERDKHASYIHENMYVFAVAVCFGVYYE